MTMQLELLDCLLTLLGMWDDNLPPRRAIKRRVTKAKAAELVTAQHIDDDDSGDSDLLDLLQRKKRMKGARLTS